jgi:hypothetical protein
LRLHFRDVDEEQMVGVFFFFSRDLSRLRETPTQNGTVTAEDMNLLELSESQSDVCNIPEQVSFDFSRAQLERTTWEKLRLKDVSMGIDDTKHLFIFD